MQGSPADFSAQIVMLVPQTLVDESFAPKATALVRFPPLEGGMDVLVDVLAFFISIVILFAMLRLFRISNDVKAIREHICSSKTDGMASAAKSGMRPLGL